MAITSYKAVVGYYNSAGTPSITTAVTGQLSDGWIPIGAPILTDAYGQCTQMMAKTDATPVIATSAYTVVTAANPQPPDATWDAQGEPLWIDTATYLQAYTKGGAYLQGTVPVSRGGTGATTAPQARENLGMGTSATYNIGTSGGNIPLLSTANTWSDLQTFVVPISKASGGTGNANGTADALTTARAIQVNLSSSASANFDGSSNVTPGVTGILPVANGGTGSNTAAGSRSNLGVAYGSSAGTVAQGNDSRLNTVDGKSGGYVNGSINVRGNVFSYGMDPNTQFASAFGFAAGDGADTQLASIYSSNYGATVTIQVNNLSAAKAFTFNSEGNGVAMSGQWIGLSDPRIKKNIQLIDDPLHKMRSLRGYTWDRADNDTSKGVGFLAPDVQVHFPQCVFPSGQTLRLTDGTTVENVLAVDTMSVAAGLHHEAILALMDKVEALEAELTALKSGK